MKRTERLLCVLTLLLLCTGCMIPGDSAGLPEFSPDNSMAAWIWTDYLSMPLDFEHSAVQTSYVYWCATARPESTQSLRLLSVGLAYSGYHLESSIHISFSPDSRYFAVVAPHILRVIDVSDGRQSDLTSEQETVSSIAWLNNREIAYAAHTDRRGEYEEITDRTFWRQRIGGQASDRALIHREQEVKSFKGIWPLEHWSPRGNFVLYMSSEFERMRLLDVPARRMQDLGPDEVYLEAVAWKDDESAVACIAAFTGPECRHVAIVIDPNSLRTVDFGDSLVRALTDRLFPIPEYAAWTPDGKYLILNDLDAGGCLIQPDPFQCMRIADALPSLSDAETGFIYRTNIHPFSVPGWVRAHDPNLCGYIIDYEGKNAVPLGEVPGTWSRDGRIAGVVGRDRRLRLQQVKLPGTVVGHQ